MGPAEFLEREWTLRFRIQGLQEELGCRLWIPSPTFEDPEDQVGFGPPGSLRRRRKEPGGPNPTWSSDRKSTRLNSSHGYISYAVFCLKKKKKKNKNLLHHSTD